MTKLVLRSLLLIIALLTFSCDRKEIKYRIGVSQCSGDYWREKTNADILREQLLHDDTYIEIRSADSDNQKQINDIRYFIDNKFDIIIVSPNETKELTPAVKEAFDKGIPVL